MPFVVASGKTALMAAVKTQRVAGLIRSGKYAIVCVRVGVWLDSECTRARGHPSERRMCPNDFHSVRSLHLLVGKTTSVEVWLG